MPTYTTADGTKMVQPGETVELGDDYANGGNVGSVYRSVAGPRRSSSERGLQRRHVLGRGEHLRPDRWNRPALPTTYLDGNLGLDNNLVDSGRSRAPTARRKPRSPARSWSLVPETTRPARPSRTARGSTRTRPSGRGSRTSRSPPRARRHDRPGRELPDARDHDPLRLVDELPQRSPRQLEEALQGLPLEAPAARTRRARSAWRSWSTSTTTRPRRGSRTASSCSATTSR